MDEILELLQENSRLSAEEIAVMLKKPVAEVKKAIKKLEKDGVIVKYGAIVNHEKLPKKKEKVQAWIEIRVTPERETGFDSLADRIARFPQVNSLYLMSGGYDYLVLVEGKTLQEVAFFVSQKLATLDRVQNTTTHFMLKKYKENKALISGKEKSARLSVTA
ncbi:MAG: Lrp/AsnC family transcriptional regulator [Candidatus Margulisbacteria bacterium]|nr:Lrp/AsnC family transcriptional regulator [Candidatus Margulisiibacteriota bacterium]